MSIALPVNALTCGGVVGIEAAKLIAERKTVLFAVFVR
jgi:hypothetical protein